LTRTMPARITCAIMTGIALFSCLPAQAASPSARLAVEHLLQSFESAVATTPSSFIDYQEMSSRCLGKDWSTLTASQRKEFVGTLKGLVEKRYYPRWRKIFGKGKVIFQGENTHGGDILVSTKLLLGKKEEMLSWRVADQSGAFKIVSLSVDNKDLLERLKTRIKAKKQKTGFAALIAWMKGKHAEEAATVSVLSGIPIAAAHHQGPSNSSSAFLFTSVAD